MSRAGLTIESPPEAVLEARKDVIRKLLERVFAECQDGEIFGQTEITLHWKHGRIRQADVVQKVVHLLDK